MESINDDQMRELNRLKAWIYQQRIKARLDLDQAERRQKREEAAAQRKAEQPGAVLILELPGNYFKETEGRIPPVSIFCI